MKYSKSLREVWEWKEKIYEETKHLSKEKYIKHLNENAENFYREYNITLRKVS